MLGLAGPAAAALPSFGCGQAAPVQPPATFAVDGVQRQAIVVVPTAYRSGEPVPLVFAFHGRTNDNARLRRYLELENAATTPTIFVYPAAVRARDGGFSWAAPDGHGPAFGLFDQMMAELERSYCIDRSRVFVVGHSLGASFANSLACARASEIAGFATVAGGIDQQHCAGRAPGILFHNPQDDLVPIAEGQAGARRPARRRHGGKPARERDHRGVSVPAGRQPAVAPALVSLPSGSHRQGAPLAPPVA